MKNVGEKITLDEAVRKSFDSATNNLYIWNTRENIFEQDIFETDTFDSIVIMWRPISGFFYASAIVCTDNNGGENQMYPLLEKQNKAGLEELRKAWPKLFQITGIFRSLS